MKKIIPFLTIFFLVLQANAQNSTIVNFVVTKQPKNRVLTVYLNDVNVGIISEGENLKVKLLSSGRFSLTLLYDDIRITNTLDVETGKEYFYECGYDYWTGNKNGLFENEIEGRNAFNLNEKTIVFEEDINNPIGKIDKNVFQSRPKQGTGFLINPEGFILTNFHVIDDAAKVEVTGIKGDFSVPFTATVIAVDRLNDLALLKIESKLVSFGTPPYDLTNSKTVSKAERVFALGYPMENSMGSEVKVTDGIINSITGFKKSVSEFQISAAVQGGNSGGPLFNSRGQVIGIVSAKISSDVADQVGYAIKSNYIFFFLEQTGITEFKSSGTISKVQSLTEQVELISDFIYVIKTK